MKVEKRYLKLNHTHHNFFTKRDYKHNSLFSVFFNTLQRWFSISVLFLDILAKPSSINSPQKTSSNFFTYQNKLLLQACNLRLVNDYEYFTMICIFNLCQRTKGFLLWSFNEILTERFSTTKGSVN